MLSKLLKYDMRWIRKLVMPILLGMLGAGLIAGTIIGVFTLIKKPEYTMMLVPVPILLIIAIFVGSTACALLIYLRFYKNLFTDEGYLSFTLPVTPTQHITSKLIATLVWQVIVAIATVVIVIAMIMTIVGFISINEPEAFGVFMQGVGTAFKFIGEGIANMFSDLQTSALSIVTILLALVGFVMKPLVVFMSLTVGAMIASKAKLLAGIGIFIAVSMVESIVVQIVSMVPVLITLNNQEVSMIISAIIMVLLRLIETIVVYFVLNRVMTKQINLA